MLSSLSSAKAHVFRASRTVTETLQARLLRRGYVTPARRGEAMERDALLLDSMEAGLARASMRGEGFARIAGSVRIEGPPVSREAMDTCLSALQARHPYLRRTIRRTPLGLALQQLNGPLRLVEHELSSELPIELLWRDIEARALKPGDPLVVVHLVRYAQDPKRTDLIVEAEHAISDGASVIALTCELVEQLSLYATNGAPRSLPPLSLSASVNARCAQHVGGPAKALLRTGQRMLQTAPRLFQLPPSTLARDKSRGIRQCSTHVVRTTLSREETERLYHLAKQRGASLSTTIGAAMSLGIGARLFPATSEAQDSSQRYFRISYSVSLRHRYAKPVRNDELGVHVSGVDPTLGLSPQSWASDDPSMLWKAARELKTELADNMRQGVDAHWLLNFVSGHAMVLPAHIPQVNLFCSLVLTDCGRYSVPSRIGAYSLKGLTPFLNGRGFSYPFLGVTPTPEGGLMLSLFAPVPALRAEDVEAVLHEATARLRAAAQASDAQGSSPAVSTEAA